MKRLWAAFAALALCAAGAGCAAQQTPAGAQAANEIVLSAFEDYYDLQKIQWNGIIGEAALNTDKTYVRGGEKSARLTIDYGDEVPVDYNDNDGGKAFSDCTRPQIVFGSYLYDASIGNLGNIDAFHISVFNANDRPVDLVFAVRDDGKKIAFSDGYSLRPGRWNDVSFDIKSYFYANGLGVSEYILYVYDDGAQEAEEMTLYFDDCFVRTTTEKTPPEKTFAEGEILGFSDRRDAAYCLTTTQSATYPAFYAAYTEREIFPGQKGCLMATIRPGNNWQYDVTVKNNGYKLQILGLAAARAAGASGLSVDCMNEGTGDLYVRLIASSASKTASVTQLLKAGTAEKPTLDLAALEGETPTSVVVQIDNWNLVGTYNVYFRNLAFAG